MPAKRKKSFRPLAFLSNSKARPLLVALIVGLVGVGYFLYQTFALQQQVSYWGALTSAKPTATYKLTTGAGTMKVAFSNNTADVTLTVTNSANQVVGSLKSIGKKDIYLSVDVSPDTYSFNLKATQAFKGKAEKGYKIAVNYPVQELETATKPTAVITSPTGTETVAGTVAFSADSQDAKGITKVDFYVDAKLLGTDTTAPYSVQWDTKSVADGVHQLAVKSTNLAGLVGEASSVATVKQPVTVAANDKFGMSAPANLWSQRLAEVGGPEHIKYRRIFLVGFDASLAKVQEAANAGMVPIISYKVSPYSWAQVASGAADADLKNVVTKLNAIPGKKFVALHHEPNGDGTPSDWSSMQIHALPILKTGRDISVGVIGNGWWWSSRAQGLSDAEIAQWIPSKVIEISDVIAADTYQDVNLVESGGPKIKNLAAWGARVGAKAVGVGEFNGLSAAGITEAMNAVKSETLVKWACVWNSEAGNLGTPLTGDRLEAFKAGLATPDQT